MVTVPTLEKGHGVIAVGKSDLWRENRQCNVEYGSGDKCPNKAKWRIVMNCCGHFDYLCHECLEAGQQFVPKNEIDYFGCDGCSTMHPTWKAAVKEVQKL